MRGDEKATSFVLTPGEDVSVTAVPYYGNSFAYWQDAEGNKYYDITYTGEAKDLTAVFNNYNQIVDGSFELGGTFATDAFAAVKQYNTTYVTGREIKAAPVVANSKDHGNNALYIAQDATKGSDANTIARLNPIPVTVEKGKQYIFSFSFYQDTASTFHLYPSVFGETEWLRYTWNSTGAKFTEASMAWRKEGGSFTNQYMVQAKDNEEIKNAYVNMGTISAKVWNEVYVMFDTTDATWLSDGTNTLYLCIGGGVRTVDSVAQSPNMYIDNLCFAETNATQTAPVAPTVTTEGNGILTAASTNAVYPVIEAYNIGIDSNLSSVSATANYPILAPCSQTYTATDGFGGVFDGWYKDGSAEPISRNRTINISNSGAYVAKFSGNLIENGDYSKNDTSNVTFSASALNGSAAHSATIKTEGEGETANSYVTLEAANSYAAGNGSADWTAFKYVFPVKQNTDYFISYKIRASVDADGNYLSNGYVDGADSDTKNPMAVLSIRDSAGGYNSAGTVQSGYYYKSGGSVMLKDMNTAYGTATQTYVDGTGGSSDWWSGNSAGKRANPGEWVTVFATINTANLSSTTWDANGESTMTICIGTGNQSHMYLDVDNVYAGEYTGNVDVCEYAVTQAPGGIATLSDKYGTSKLPVTYTAVADKGNAFLGWYEDGATTPVSTELNYVPTNAVAGTAYNLTPKFNCNNQITDGSFENGVGLTSWKANTSSGYAGIYTETTGLTGKGINAAVANNCLMSTKLPVTVNKNTDYIWQFNFKINEWAYSGDNSNASVFSPMVSETGEWKSWPKLGSWHLTIRSVTDGTVYSLRASEDAMDEQIKFSELTHSVSTNGLSSHSNLTQATI